MLAALEDGAGARGRQHVRLEAFRALVGIRARDGADLCRGRIAAGRRQHRHGFRQRDRRRARGSSRRRQSGVHRRGCHRCAGLSNRRARPQARHDGARRQIRADRVRGRESRQRRQRRRVGHLRRHRPDVRRGLARARASLDPRRIRRAVSEARAHRAHGRSAARNDSGRANHDETAICEGLELHRDREAARREGDARRLSRGPARMRRRLVRRANRVHGRHARHAHRARRSVRTCAVDH